MAQNKQVTSYDVLEAITLEKGHAFANKEIISVGKVTYLMKQNTHVNYVFDEVGQRIVLDQNEIVLPSFMKNSLSLQRGDIVYLDLYGKKQEFLFKTFMKDSFLGNAMIGNARYLISDEAFETLNSHLLDEQKTIMLMSNCEKGYKLMNTYLEKGFPAYRDLHRETTEVAFIGSSVSLSMMLMLASIIFMLIAIMTLRFAIVTTLNEEYREIGKPYMLYTCL